MLVIKNEEHFKEVVDFACKTGRAEQLFEKLLYLHHYADHDAKGTCKVHLYKDFAPASFGVMWEFVEGWQAALGNMHGAMVFHGAHDGWGSGTAPSFSVCLDPTDGWSIHT
jgi:hypothetical protein